MPGACQSILSMAKQADVSRLNQQQINSFCYITLASLLLLGMKQEFNGLFETWADSKMQAPNMQSQLSMAAALPKAGLDDLRILTNPRISRETN